MSFISEVETVFVTGVLKWNRTINEKGRIIHIVFLAELTES